MTRLDGKAIIVTGAGQGLGRAYALACAAAGASVIVNDVDGKAAAAAVAQISEAGGLAAAVCGSVGSWEVAARLSAVCLERFGAVDGLVANAGIMRASAPWDETEEDLRAIAEVNVLGVQFAARHAMRAMVDAGHGGSIVTIVSGAQFGIRGMSAYGATKGAVNAMTLNWALAGMEHGIRVNALSPVGLTRMAMQDLREERPEFPDPAVIAPAVVALLSDDTAAVTGRIIRFDGTILGGYSTELEPIDRRLGWSADDVAEALRTTFQESR